MGFDSRRVLRALVADGSNSPPDCYSLPPLFESLRLARSRYPFEMFFISWWRWWDSNPWPPACRAGALPAELHPHCRMQNAKCKMQNCWVLLFLHLSFLKKVVGPSGLEPPTSCLSGTRSNLLSYDPMWLGFSVNLTLGLSVVGTVLSVPIPDVSIELFSRTVSRKVSSPLQSLTSVFGMGTGGPSAFVTLTSIQLTKSVTENWTT